MPLTKGLRDEENERISNILRHLMDLAFVPGFNEADVNELLSRIAISLDDLTHFSAAELILYLEKLHFDWDNAEKFADFILKLSETRDDALGQKQKAVAIYEYIQLESQTFSFGIFNKISEAKA